MYKFFAKTVFLGKNTLFLPQCHSTNDEARLLNQSNRLQHGTIVWTDYQTGGKGQQGNAWLSEHGKNLLFTLCLSPESLDTNKQYLLNLVSSLALHEVLASLLPSSKVEIKWPNDMYVNDYKIAGILNETVISKGKSEQVYCGIGLNVNQSHFNLPNAISMRMITARKFDRVEILENLLLSFEEYYAWIENKADLLITEYEKRLRWLGEPRTFKVSEEEIEGVIQGIDGHGKLLLKSGIEIQSFDVKEIEFLH